MSSTELKEFIRNKAFELGFTHIGFSNAYKNKEEKLTKWLENGYHATMQWMENRAIERSNIYEYYPDVKTIISLSINYFTGNAKDQNKFGKISNYAWGDDYHKLIKGKLIKLLQLIQKKYPKVNGLTCVDTAPIMEKFWAQKAGIGWIGKHTNLITKTHGSWVFLGELILNHHIKPDIEFNDDLCGSCTACLDACPTNAFPEPYVLDASKCISYLTIEHRDDFKKNTNLEGWIYGCDICQEVCPWNIKFSQNSSEPSFQIRNTLQNKNLKDWELLTEEQFKKIFKGSAIKRTKFKGLKRNISAVIRTN